jgi:hypothetical protein
MLVLLKPIFASSFPANAVVKTMLFLRHNQSCFLLPDLMSFLVNFTSLLASVATKPENLSKEKTYT